MECGGLTPPSPLGLYARGTLRRRQAAALQGASRILMHGGEPQHHEVSARNDTGLVLRRMTGSNSFTELALRPRGSVLPRPLGDMAREGAAGV